MFLPPKSEIAALKTSGASLVTVESQTLVRDFDILAFSVSFEWDYTNVVTMLRLAGIPVRAEDRTHHDPLVMIGGAVTFVNPEPLALFADVIAAGEGEALIPPLLEVFKEASDRDDLLHRLAQVRGYYIPSFYDVHYRESGSIERFEPKAGTGAPAVVRKAALKTTEAVDPPVTSIFTPDTEFGSRFLVEVVRGCANLCRFCWAGYNYLPVRAFPEGAHPASSPQAARPYSTRAGLVSIALVRSPGHRGDPHAPGGDGLQHQSGVAAARRPDADDSQSAARQRRAHRDDRARGRIRSASAGRQQDGDQRRDPRRCRDDLRVGDGEPEALLHDRHPHRDRRRPGGDPRPDRCRCATS